MLSIRCILLRDTFEGGAPDDPLSPEWPPSPMRLFSALVSVADHAGHTDDEVLRLLETMPPPEIYASWSLHDRQSHRRAFVPTNAVVAGGGSTTLPGRTNGERAWARAIPESPEIWYRWPEGELDLAGLIVLKQLCWRVPYFGRSTSPAIVEVVDDRDPPPQLRRLVPAPAEADDAAFVYATSVRAPLGGTLQALREAHDAKYLHGDPSDPWQIGQPVDYGVRHEVQPERLSSGPFVALVVLALRSARLDGRHAARVSSYVRRALLHRLGGQNVPALHGHHDGSVVQCAVLALPFVGSEHADGHLLGVALALPEMAREDLQALHGALPVPGSELLVHAGPLGELRLQRLSPLDMTQRRATWGLDPGRWSQASTTWTTALPAVLDRYLKRHDDVETEARRAVVRSGYPEPLRVEVSVRPTLRGALDLRPEDTVRRRSERGFKPYRHLRLTFAERLQGPVVIGSMRHYGLGLCVPLTQDDDP